MKELKLNRLFITGPLNENTPYCVIKEILESHNISHQPMKENEIKFANCQVEIQKINMFRTLTIEEPFDSYKLRYLATFINFKVGTWTKSSLLQAYIHMMNFEFENLDKLKQLDIECIQKTPNNVKTLNSCMLYKICVHYNIATKWNTNERDMCFLIKKLFESHSDLKSHILSLIETYDKEKLVNLYLHLPKEKGQINPFYKEKSPDKEILETPLASIDSLKLQESFNNYTDIKNLIQNAKSYSHYDAIILALLNYKINLTESKYPLLEYKEILKNPSLELYVPIDPIFKKRYLRNPDWYNFDYMFNINFSSIYNEKDLKNMCIREGYTIDDIRANDCKNLLYKIQKSENIYFGKNVYNFDEEYTPIMMDEIKNLENKECFSFGVYEKKSFKTFSAYELSELFTIHKSYRNPLRNNEVLEERIINKLKFFANRHTIVKMLKAIDIVEKWRVYSNENSEKLRDFYKKSERKDIILEFFNLIIQTGMYMRGWKGSENPFPLSEKSSKVEGIQDKIEENVAQSIDKIMKYIFNLRENERNLLCHLPLMKFSIDGENKVFIPTPDEEDGDSIIHRLKIVVSGNSHKNMKSCIRLSSNIVLSSVYFYICSLGLKEPFNICDLDHIT
jgi:hypothetical protein